MCVLKKLKRNVMVGITAAVAGMTMTGCSQMDGGMTGRKLMAEIQRRVVQNQMENHDRQAEELRKNPVTEKPAADEEEYEQFVSEITQNVFPGISGFGTTDVPIACVYGPAPVQPSEPDAQPETAQPQSGENTDAETQPENPGEPGGPQENTPQPETSTDTGNEERNPESGSPAVEASSEAVTEAG